MNCDLDVVLVVDRSQSVESDYQKELKTAGDLVALASKSAFDEGKVRVGVASFAQDAQIELNLSKNRRENVSQVIEGIYHTGGTTSAVRGVDEALKYLVPKRRKTAKLLFVLISDGHSQDYWHQLIATSTKVRSLPNSLFLAATNSEHYSLNELATWTRDPNNVYHSRQIPNFLQRIRDEMRKCGVQSGKADQLIAKVTSSKEPKPRAETIQVEGSGEAVEGSGQQHDIITSDHVIESSAKTITEETPLSNESHKEKTRGIVEFLEEKDTETATESGESKFDGKGPCKVDLLFVIDISTSVEEEFEKQRQFTVDLIERLPVEDFESRVHVGVVAFHKRAKILQSLDAMTSRLSTINMLESIKNEGGQTSVVQGMALATKEIQRARRRDARQILVLLSDGNSRDLWRDVVSTADSVKRLGVDVYAVTVHRNHHFSELETYATSSNYVYVNDRIRQFLDETERALRKCLSPNFETAPLQAAKTVQSTNLEQKISKKISKRKISIPGGQRCQNRSNNRSLDSLGCGVQKEGREEGEVVEAVAEAEFDAENDLCATERLDLLFLFDNYGGTQDTNKFLILDILGSLMHVEGLRVAVISMADPPKLEIPFRYLSEKNDVMKKTKRVEASPKRGNYSKSFHLALDEITLNGRSEAKKLMIIVGDGEVAGEAGDGEVEETSFSKHPEIKCFAVDSSKRTNIRNLSKFTTSRDHVFDFDRNPEFQRLLLESAKIKRENCRTKFSKIV